MVASVRYNLGDEHSVHGHLRADEKSEQEIFCFS